VAAVASKCAEACASAGTWITEGISFADGGCANAKVAQKIIRQQIVAAKPFCEVIIRWISKTIDRNKK
jgi:hypothetical protein